MTTADLERIIDGELRRLPGPQAPSTFLPRLMAAVREAAPRPWYQRAWLGWPLRWQLMSGALFVAVVAGLALVVPSVHAALSSFMAPLSGAPAARAAEIGRAAGPMLRLGRVLWGTLLQPALVYVLALVTVMGVASALVATALGRVALGGARHS